jgi:hypothetical protein
MIPLVNTRIEIWVRALPPTVFTRNPLGLQKHIDQGNGNLDLGMNFFPIKGINPSIQSNVHSKYHIPWRIMPAPRPPTCSELNPLADSPRQPPAPWIANVEGFRAALLRHGCSPFHLSRETCLHRARLKCGIRNKNEGVKMSNSSEPRKSSTSKLFSFIIFPSILTVFAYRHPRSLLPLVIVQTFFKAEPIC